jgi:uncharacterized membrane protein
MNATGNSSPPGLPVRRFDWMKALLIASLALNLLFVGGAFARFMMYGPPERMSGMSQMQLIPRKFFGELAPDRRRELLAVFKSFGKDFRDGRKVARQQVVNLAAALETEPYDPARVKAVVDSFSQQSAALVGTGGKAALTLIEKLSPEERKLLARHIRLRDDGGKPHGGRPEGG